MKHAGKRMKKIEFCKPQTKQNKHSHKLLRRCPMNNTVNQKHLSPLDS